MPSPSNIEQSSNRLKMIAQPYYGKRLRYRSDYDKNKSRLGVLKNRNEMSTYQGPAIRIPKCFLDDNEKYYIRVTLVTVPYENTNVHYVHPYILENPSDESANERPNNSVWFPIVKEDRESEIKSFPLLRIVKLKAENFREYGPLRPFDCDVGLDPNLKNNLLEQGATVKDTITKFNLTKSQLAFVVGKECAINGQISFSIYSDSTEFSAEMVEGDSTATDNLNDDNSSIESSPAISSGSRVYKYAPKYGFSESSEEMIMYLTKKLEPKIYGELKITFECDLPSRHWSESVNDIETIKDQMISFKIPIFSENVETIQRVQVILRQNDQVISACEYYYISTLARCEKCQFNTIFQQTGAIKHTSNKRPALTIPLTDVQDDSVVPSIESTIQIESPTSPEQLLNSSETKPDNVNLLSATNVEEYHENSAEKFKRELQKATEALFINDDNTLILRVCRPFVKISPMLLHQALEKSHYNVLLRYIPVALTDSLLYKNESGENILLHSIRRNCTELVQCLLKKNQIARLVAERDNKKNNILHLVSIHTTLTDIVDSLLNYLTEQAFSIQEKFDEFNQDGMTPLQLAICNNKLAIAKVLWKHSDTTVYRTQDRTGDNLIHLAVRYADLPMLQYLVEECKLTKQIRQSNLHMTPEELAKYLKRDNLRMYLNELCSEDELDEDDD